MRIKLYLKNVENVELVEPLLTALSDVELVEAQRGRVVLEFSEESLLKLYREGLRLGELIEEQGGISLDDVIEDVEISVSNIEELIESKLFVVHPSKRYLDEEAEEEEEEYVEIYPIRELGLYDCYVADIIVSKIAQKLPCEVVECIDSSNYLLLPKKFIYR